MYMCSDCTEDFSTETSFKVHFEQYHDSVILTEDPTILNLGYFHETVDEDISFKRKLKQSQAFRVLVSRFEINKLHEMYLELIVSEKLFMGREGVKLFSEKLFMAYEGVF